MPGLNEASGEKRATVLQEHGERAFIGSAQKCARI